MRSAGLLLGAVIRIFFPSLAYDLTRARIVVVLPVPGGPNITKGAFLFALC